MDKIQIQGTCSKGYESVKALFEENFRKGHEVNSQLCIYVEGDVVVDLYGTAIGDTKYGPDTLTNMFSSGKSIAAIVVAMMVDKGLLAYDQKVENYWPEFGKHGKNEITLADVLYHEAGLQDFNHTLKASNYSRDGIKSNVMSDIIEGLEPVWPTKELGCINPDGSETRRAYHSLSRGWILNEIVRRVHPQHLTIGEIMENEIGIDGIRCGLKEEEIKNTSPLMCKSLSWLLLQSLTPKVCGRLIDMNFVGLVKLFGAKKTEFQKLMASNKPSLEGLPQKLDVIKLGLTFNDSEVQKGEMPSANMHGSAKGMAKLASIMANEGKYYPEKQSEGVKEDNMISQDTWKKMHEGEKVLVDSNMLGMSFRTNFTQGGVCVFALDKYGDEDEINPMEKTICAGRQGFYGWFGFGGSILQWHPELKIGFGYIPTNLHWWEMNTIGGSLQKLTIECAERQKGIK